MPRAAAAVGTDAGGATWGTVGDAPGWATGGAIGRATEGSVDMALSSWVGVGEAGETPVRGSFEGGATVGRGEVAGATTAGIDDVGSEGKVDPAGQGTSINPGLRLVTIRPARS